MKKVKIMGKEYYNLDIESWVHKTVWAQDDAKKALNFLNAEIIRRQLSATRKDQQNAQSNIQLALIRFAQHGVKIRELPDHTFALEEENVTLLKNKENIQKLYNEKKDLLLQKLFELSEAIYTVPMSVQLDVFHDMTVLVHQSLEVCKLSAELKMLQECLGEEENEV